MKIFAVKDEEDFSRKALAYLLYYERPKQFYIELPDDADPWETPLILSSFAKQGERTINAYWSKLWVQQRIVPMDRQNLGQILKDNGLKEYDEFDLLMLADGRCAQDSYYLEPIGASDLPDSFLLRYQKKVEDVVPLNHANLLVFFRDGSVKKYNATVLLSGKTQFRQLLKNENLFRKVNVQPGGYGICWGENLTITDSELYEHGKPIPLSMEDFRDFVSYRIVGTREATEILDCSRQNIDDLVRRDKLHPVKTDSKNKLFLKSEILQRNWK